ncbi:hypothetical protein BGZ58_007302 [Dissophora ornata]|nr:hypothetical protein BGZ58_007302 [Dissophora ornata]
MSRQRSRSTSSMGTLSKSPISLTASLSTSVALYDNQEPPKTLQDILLLAQSHYISHRYIPALTLYKLAAERHHSLPACSSLYALYTSTLNLPGLARSDTKATHILIHALRIWTARRWSSSRLDESGSMRSQTRDEHDELEEYFAHPRRIARTQQKPISGTSIPSRRQTDPQSRSIGVVAQSVESEYRTPLHLTSRSNVDLSGEEDENLDEESGNESEDDDCDSCEDCDSDDCDEYDEGTEDDEQEREEQARRIGVATEEIEGIVQKLCSMIQKGVLALDEPVLVDAVSTLRKIERGLSKEAEAWTQELAKSRSLFTSTLSGNATDEATSTRPDLLLTQGIDLSFLNFSPVDVLPVAKPQPVRRSTQLSPPERLPTPVSPEFVGSPANSAISSLPSDEQEQDQTMCRAIRIRVMFTLGWVHQKKNEYHYGAQAYGVCSEIPTTAKRLLNALQHQASVQKQVCRALEAEEQEKSKSELIHAQEPRTNVAPSLSSSSSKSSSKTSTKGTSASSASSIYNSSETSTTATHPDISSPSSLAGSDSAPASIRGPISSLSAAMWNSGLFRSGSSPSVLSAKKEASPKSNSILDLQRSSNLHRSKSLHELKVDPSGTAVATEAKDSHHHHHHHPRVQQGSKGHQHQAPVLTMSGHHKKVVKCGYCGQKRVLMPLCVCKKVRYCNGECRRADLDTHRLTDCPATKIRINPSPAVNKNHSSPAVSEEHYSASTDVAL